MGPGFTASLLSHNSSCTQSTQVLTYTSIPSCPRLLQNAWHQIIFEGQVLIWLTVARLGKSEVPAPPGNLWECLSYPDMVDSTTHSRHSLSKANAVLENSAARPQVLTPTYCQGPYPPKLLAYDLGDSVSNTCTRGHTFNPQACSNHTLHGGCRLLFIDSVLLSWPDPPIFSHLTFSFLPSVCFCLSVSMLCGLEACPSLPGYNLNLLFRFSSNTLPGWVLLKDWESPPMH